MPQITEAVFLGQSAVIAINGGANNFDGLTLAPGSDKSVIQGLDIVNFKGAGIHVQSQMDTIEGNWIGTDSTGLVAGPGNAVFSVSSFMDTLTP